MSQPLFAVLFKDNPANSHLRPEYLDAHLDFIRRHTDMIVSAGSVKEESAEKPYGGLWIIRAESESAVRQMFSDDPFWKNGIRESVSVFHWKTVLENGKMLI